MLITNIKELIGINEAGVSHLRGKQMADTGRIADAWLRIEGNRVAGYGKMSDLVRREGEAVTDATGRYVIPAFCDSHTHLVYAGCRYLEFIDKINGLSYEEIAKRGGGILNSADLLNVTSEDELFNQSLQRVHEVMRKGTGCIEIKSGYGLTLESELKMLRVIARISESVPATVRATFLGAHAVGRAYQDRQQDYVDHVCRDMIPAVAAEGLADFVDVFCDEGFFTPAQTRAIAEAGAKFGMRPKLHANELAISGGVQVGVECGALSVDHLERIGDEECELLGANNTVATMLPGASFFLGMPYGPARRVIESDGILALASDYNPGSSPSGDMRFVWALACSQMKLNPIVALNALTINGAYAMGLSEMGFGSIAVDSPANFIITEPMADIAVAPYAYNTPWIHRVCLDGKLR